MLPKILGYKNETEFFENYYGMRPFAYRGAVQVEPNWLAERIASLLRHPAADIIIGNHAGAVRSDLTPKDYADCLNVMNDGYTVGLRHLQLYDPMSATIAEEFQQAFHGEVDIHLYGTSGSQRGFGWHYDAEEVFILQVAGSKEWLFRKNTLNPWPLVETLPTDMGFQHENSPIMSCKLETNDWLYLPIGYWHSTRAIQNSFSLSIGVNRPSCLNIYEYFRERLLNDLRWRARLPSAFFETSDEARSIVKSLLSDLGHDLLRLFNSDREIDQLVEHLRKYSRESPVVD